MLFLCVLTNCLWRSYQTLRAFLLNARVYLSDASQTHWQSYNIAIAVYIFYNFYFVLRSNGTCMACTVWNCLKGNFFWSLCFSTKLKKNHKKTELHDDDVIQKKQQPKSCCLFAEREGFEPPVPLSTAVFKTAVIDHSTISPNARLLKSECKGKEKF